MVSSSSLLLQTFVCWHLIACITSFSLTMKDTLVIGLNPALQRSVSIANLVVGSVNRGTSVNIGIGGKGQDVVVAAASMQADPPPTVLQFLGRGAEGDVLLAAIKKLQPHTFVNALSIRTAAPCRVCVTLVDTVKGEATEIVEPSGTISTEEIDFLLLATERQYTTEKVGGVAVMGSMPPGCPPSLYGDILRRVCDQQTKVLLDTATSVIESLNVCKELQCSAMLKVNARELCKLAGIADVGGAEASVATSGEIVYQACKALAEKLQLSTSLPSPSSFNLAAAVTDGPYPARLIPLVVNGQATLFSDNIPPSVSSTQDHTGVATMTTFTMTRPLPRPLRNPIGAGDAVASGTLMRWCEAVDIPSVDTLSIATKAGSSPDPLAAMNEAFLWGLSCGAASCMTGENSVFNRDEAVELYRNHYHCDHKDV